MTYKSPTVTQYERLAARFGHSIACIKMGLPDSYRPVYAELDAPIPPSSLEEREVKVAEAGLPRPKLTECTKAGFQEALIKALEQRGMDHYDLANLCGVTPEGVRNWVRGKCLPNAFRLQSICVALDEPGLKDAWFGHNPKGDV